MTFSFSSSANILNYLSLFVIFEIGMVIRATHEARLCERSKWHACRVGKFNASGKGVRFLTLQAAAYSGNPAWAARIRKTITFVGNHRSLLCAIFGLFSWDWFLRIFMLDNRVL